MSQGKGINEGLNAEMNVTPLVDVMLVILVIVMLVLAPVQQQLEVSPSLKSSNSIDDPQSVWAVSMLAGNQFIWRERRFDDLLTLQNAMLEAKRQQTEPPRLVLTVHDNVSYGQWLKVLTTLRDAGFNNTW